MARFLAFIAAVAMVVGAIAVRNRIDDRPGLGTSGDRRSLVCATELSNVCNVLGTEDASIDVTIEPAGVTAARLKSVDEATLELDAWLVPQPWPVIVDEARQRAARAPLFEPKPRVLARSPLVLVAWTDRAQALQRKCGRPIDPKCVGEAAAAPGTWTAIGGDASWGLFKPFHADPNREASGLIAAAAGTIGFHGSAAVSAADLEEDAFLAWLHGLVQAMPNGQISGATAVQDLLTKGPAAFDVVAALEAEAGPAVASSSRRDKLQVIYPSPVLTADLVLARRDGGKAGRIADFVEDDPGKKVLAADGWRLEGVAPVAGVARGPLPPTNGLPSAGLLDALGRRWLEASR